MREKNTIPRLIVECVQKHAQQKPASPALLYKDQVLDYQSLWQQTCSFASGLIADGLQTSDRVAIFLPKQFETVIAILGTALAGGAFVPVNPLLKPQQVAHILADCNVRVLVTAKQRLKSLEPILGDCPGLCSVVVVDDPEPDPLPAGLVSSGWERYLTSSDMESFHRRIDTDMAAILYTSGSTGSPKGVVLSHRNLFAGADSVADYLENGPDDRVLALLPLSFDAGLSQLTTMFLVGGSAVLMDYLLPGDVLKALQRHAVTGLAAVPPVWNQLVSLEWPQAVAESLRYITNTGGAMPVATTQTLSQKLPNTSVYLMYGLTEAFRSTYLPPEEVSRRPQSIGKAIPNAEILVVDEQGRECPPNEPGELVHRGALVAMGYWNAPDLTARRFRPAPLRPGEIVTPELAVWSGDRVYRDEDGFLYFVGREDDMIKSSGYRISPSEVEDAAHATGLISQAAALGLTQHELGQAILLVVVPAHGVDEAGLSKQLLAAMTRELPAFMVPRGVEIQTSMPVNPNGKIDRKALAGNYDNYFNNPNGI